MLPQPRRIARLVALFASVGLLLAIFGFVVVLTGMADRLLGPVPVRGAEAQSLSEASTRAHSSGGTHPTGTWTTPGRRSLAASRRDHRRPLDRFSAQLRATIGPVGLDRSYDLRADLKDMAISIRWHRGPGSGLPLGSD